MPLSTLGRSRLAWAALLAVPLPASAQLVSGFVGSGRATEKDISTPSSHSWTVQSLPIAGVSVYAGRTWSADAPHHAYTTCDSYWPTFVRCVDEKVEGGFKLNSASYGLAYRYGQRSWFAEAGYRRVFYTMRGRLVGLETRRPVAMVLPSSSGSGLDVTAGRKLPLRGLSVVARYSSERVNLHFVSDDVFTPFDRPFSVQTVSVGLQWSPLNR